MSIDATAVIRQESERLVSVLTATDPGQKVPTCPDWTADDLLWHVAEVHEFWTAILAAGATTEDEVMAIEEAKQPRPDGREAVLERRTEVPEEVHRRWAEILAAGDEVMPRFPLPLGDPAPQPERVEVRDVLDVDDTAALSAQARADGVSTLRDLADRDRVVAGSKKPLETAV